MTPCMQNAGFRSLNTNVKLLRFLFTVLCFFIVCIYGHIFGGGRGGFCHGYLN